MFQLKKNQVNKKLTDPKEMERLLMIYSGIFKNKIEEFSKKIYIPSKKRINIAK